MDLILHIGTEKTGTTTVQEFLVANRAGLSRRGIALSRVLGTGNNRLLAARFQPRPDGWLLRRGVRDAADRQRFFHGFADRLDAEIAEAARHHGTMILTCEQLHSRLQDPESVGALAGFLRPRFGRIRVLCYVREQAEMLRSLHSTALRTGCPDPLERFRADLGPDDLMFNHHDSLAIWAGAFGEDTVTAAVHDSDRFRGGDLCRDFLWRATGREIAEGLEQALAPRNRRLADRQARMLLRLNRMLTPQGPAGYSRTAEAMRRILMAAILRMPGGKGQDLPACRRAAIWEAFDASNRRFAARFLGHPANPFRPPRRPGRGG